MKTKFLTNGILLATISLALSACGTITFGEAENTAITASGTISAEAHTIASRLGGTVADVFFDEGAAVTAGDVLFTLDDEMMRAQFDQAAAAVEVTRAGLDAAQAQLVSVEIQYEQALQGARLLDMEARSNSWRAVNPNEFELPVWYFEKSEQIAAAQAEIEAASDAMAINLADFESVLADVSNDDFVAAEIRLAEARARFLISDQTLQQARLASNRVELENAAEEELDAALADLEAVQLDYERMLSTRAAEEVLEVRAQVAVARSRLDKAIDQVSFLLSGEESLIVTAANSAIELAVSAVAQAEAGLGQAEAALNVLEVQLGMAEIDTPVDGIILARSLEKGEIVAPGSTVFVVGLLDEVTLTVYIPEDQYGRIRIGQEVEVTVDSYPAQIFSGVVQRIADEAEFTPRNVQTVEGRLTTVYAVDISVPNAYHELKPGMPADVVFLGTSVVVD